MSLEPGLTAEAERRAGPHGLCEPADGKICAFSELILLSLVKEGEDGLGLVYFCFLAGLTRSSRPRQELHCRMIWWTLAWRMGCALETYCRDSGRQEKDFPRGVK